MLCFKPRIQAEHLNYTGAKLYPFLMMLELLDHAKTILTIKMLFLGTQDNFHYRSAISKKT